mmetsp:Transcript_466/g.1771  ORF Transcript_466/g.1771 Transcript_466/m.1771 type:complete len:326 (-) Transcript_466:67-1044(-)
MYLRCSSSVVAPTHCIWPRESAGFIMLEMSMPPPPPPPRPMAPAPTSVWISSIMRMRSSSPTTSSSSLVTRFSSSPRSLAPAMSRPMSSETMRLSTRKSGHLPETMRTARPAPIAVLPTPGSPSRMGLFLRRRARISTQRATSLSRPITGSILPLRASSVRSVPNSSSMDSCSPFWPALPALPAAFAADTLAPLSGGVPFSALSSVCSCASAPSRSFMGSSPSARIMSLTPSSTSSSASRMCSALMYWWERRWLSLTASSKARLAPIENGTSLVGRMPPRGAERAFFTCATAAGSLIVVPRYPPEESLTPSAISPRRSCAVPTSV